MYMIDLNDLCPFFIQLETKPIIIVTHLHNFSHIWHQQRVVSSNFNWFTVLFVSFVIGYSDYYGFVLWLAVGNCSSLMIWVIVGQGCCLLFMSKTLHSHSASLCSRVVPPFSVKENLPLLYTSTSHQKWTSVPSTVRRLHFRIVLISA